MLDEFNDSQWKQLLKVEDRWTSLLLDGSEPSSSSVLAAFGELCGRAGVGPARFQVASGPLEAQGMLMALRPNESHSQPERRLERFLRRRVWDPAVRQMQVGVSETVLRIVTGRLSRTFRGLTEQLETVSHRTLLNTRFGSGLSTDVYAAALLDFFEELGIVQSEEWTWWKRLLQARIWSCLLSTHTAVAVVPPVGIRVLWSSQDGPVLHSTAGPAIEWRDGTRSYWLRRKMVDPVFFEEPDSAPLQVIRWEPDPQNRQELINLVGLPRYLSKTKVTVLDQDVDLAGMTRRLLALKLEFDERWCVVEVRCPSKGDTHYLWVPPEMEKCSQAVAWTFGFDVEEYAPLVEA